MLVANNAFKFLNEFLSNFTNEMSREDITSISIRFGVIVECLQILGEKTLGVRRVMTCV